MGGKAIIGPDTAEHIQLAESILLEKIDELRACRSKVWADKHSEKYKHNYGSWDDDEPSHASMNWSPTMGYNQQSTVPNCAMVPMLPYAVPGIPTGAAPQAAD